MEKVQYIVSHPLRSGNLNAPRKTVMQELIPKIEPPGFAKLDISTKLLLAPWFSEKNLLVGAGLLSQHISHTMFYRNIGGGIFNDGQTCLTMVVFEPAPQLSQKFRISSSRCSQCGNAKTQEHCPHAAALAVAFLQKNTAISGEPLPLPMNFPISPWFTAGQILFDLYGSGTDNILSITPAPQGIWRLTFDEKAGRSMGSMLITTSVLAETAAI